MSEKKFPKDKELQDLAVVMRAFAATCDEAVKNMHENAVTELPIDNWDTALRGLDYLNRAMEAISSAYVLGKASPMVRDLLAVYKTQKKAVELAEKKTRVKKKQ